MGRNIFPHQLMLIASLSMFAMISVCDDRQPFYLFGHMLNNLDRLKQSMLDGANAAEVDVQFSAEGELVRIYHGFPCDCFRDCFDSNNFTEYVSFVRDMGSSDSSTYNPNMTVLYLDLKLDSITPSNLNAAGKQLALIIQEHFFQNGKSNTMVKIVIGIPNTYQEDFAVGFIGAFDTQSNLLNNIGFDFSNNEALNSISEVVNRLQLKNVWQGRGATNCIWQPYFGITEALDLRNSSGSYMQKVYDWTIDSYFRIYNDLKLRVDGLMTNQVTRVFNVINSDEFTKVYRLATTQDNPWENYFKK